ncbi:MAG TPA: diaminopimelate decarboxylase [Anaerolineales bacterium]|nr:diaminopimelate decarboxylase [Anaerolineales bacterium]HND91474.1 diaminopimelate decarboxylase [Anaerolineales bacterium]HNH04033.1 diaminopimelate decarboxylase [Anaerolineales bacterium]
MMNRIDLFPVSAKIEQDRLTIAGHDLELLAKEYGTPLYLYDQKTMDDAALEYKNALASHYPGPGSVTYAGKAYLCTAIAQWAHGHELYVDCTGEVEIAFAQAGGVPREHILVHGVNKSQADLKSALQHAGTIVVDNLTELKNIAAVSTVASNLWFRLLPGLAVETHHAHTQTGQHGSKFGMTRTEIMEAADICRQHHLPINGIHFHQGSNFRDARPLKEAIGIGLDIAKEIGVPDVWHFSPGGGWGVAYHEDELPQPDTNEYVRVIAENVLAGCQSRGLTLPHLHLEPGRSLVARAGVSVYRAGAIKKRDEKTWVLVDGGMTDNPRHAMYGARYSCLPVSGVGAERSGRISIAGPFCESGDVVIEDLPMRDIHEGDLIAIPASGAYQLSMSSNYNGSRRPAVLWLEKGNARLIQRRETIQDLLARDVMI